MKAIVSKYHGPSGIRGARYSATDNDGHTAYVEANNRLNSEQNHQKAVEKLCTRLDWHGTLVSGGLMKAGASVGLVWVWQAEGNLKEEVLAV